MFGPSARCAPWVLRANQTVSLQRGAGQLRTPGSLLNKTVELSISRVATREVCISSIRHLQPRSLAETASIIAARGLFVMIAAGVFALVLREFALSDQARSR
jgi:hypothetical protein